MSHLFDSQMKFTARVRKAIKEAIKLISWAAQSEDPFEVMTWLESLDITELPAGNVGIGIIDLDQADALIPLTPLCRICLHFEIDADPKKRFWVELELADTHRAGWAIISCRSGEPGLWFQQHFACGYTGIETRYLHCINTRRNLEKMANILDLFQFPFRDIPATVK